MRPLSNAIEKIKYIYKLIVATPRYKLVIFLQFVSGAASIVGLPLLVPVLNYMRGSAASAEAVGPLRFIETAFNSVGLEANFYTILTIASIFILTGQCLIFVSALIAANAQVTLSELYRKDIFRAYGKADWLWLINNRSGEMNYSVIKEAEMASVAHLNAQRVFIYSVQVFVFLFIAVTLSPIITLLALAIYGVLAVFSVLNSDYVRKLADVYNERFKKLSNDLSGLQQNKKFFKTSMLNEKQIKGIFRHVGDITKVTKGQNVHIEMQRTISLMVTFLFLISLMFFHKQLALSYSVLLLMLLIFLRIAPEFSRLSTAYASLDSNIPMYRSLHKRLNDLRRNKEENGSEPFDENGIIRFDDVSFSYPDRDKVLDKLNMVIEPHKATAFIGSTGVGKSTLLDLILGLLRPAAGTIFYGNIPHDRLDKNSLRSKIAYVSQETTLIDGTLKENLGIRSVVDLNEEIIISLGFKDIIRTMEENIGDMPNWLETQVGENGVKLSGGQRQRVALMRALIAAPKILILDEATSNLDSESERLMQETIKSLQKDLTIIIVTHKLSAVRFADRIYVLDEGKVCESGNYKELLEQKGKLHFFDSLQK